VECDLLDALASQVRRRWLRRAEADRADRDERAYQLPAVVAKEEHAEQYVFAGPSIKRMSAEQFVDAVATLTNAKLDTKPSKLEGAPMRAVMTIANPLTVAMGRPNREQVVTNRPSAATTLQALELTNGPTLSEMLPEGREAACQATGHRRQDPDRSALRQSRQPRADRKGTGAGRGRRRRKAQGRGRGGLALGHGDAAGVSVDSIVFWSLLPSGRRLG
jgi:hypothetical protein